MKLVSRMDFGAYSAETGNVLTENEMVITNDGPVALMPSRDTKDTPSAARRARAINALKLIQQRSVKNGLDKMTLEEIDE